LERLAGLGGLLAAAVPAVGVRHHHGVEEALAGVGGQPADFLPLVALGGVLGPAVPRGHAAAQQADGFLDLLALGGEALALLLLCLRADAHQRREPQRPAVAVRRIALGHDDPPRGSLCPAGPRGDSLGPAALVTHPRPAPRRGSSSRRARWN